MYDQIQIVDSEEASGIYEFRLNFDGNRLWESTGTVARVKAHAALLGHSSFTSSRLTTELISALGDVQVDLNDGPKVRYNDGSPQVGSFIRECFETARENGYRVTLLVGRYDKETLVFQEIVFRGSMNPHEVPYAHRWIPKGIRRHETIACEFSAAIDLDTHLGEIQWQYDDMALGSSRPVFGPIACEPSDPGNFFNYYRFLETRLSRYITTGATVADDVIPFHPRELTHIVAYGANPRSRKSPPDTYRDENPAEGTWPIGNWVVTYGKAIEKACEIIDWEWDGVLPDLNARQAEFDNGNNVNEDVGQLDVDALAFSFNYGFGISPLMTGKTFKGPCTWDTETEIRQMFAHIAAQFISRADISGYTSTGKPILSFIGIGQDVGPMPDMGAGYARPDSSEDSFVTEADGVEIVRRGFDGSVIAPASSRKPVKIEIPFGTHAIAYETTPPFNASRCMVNSSVEFHEQWRCGYRGAIGDASDTAEETGEGLNPDGWGLASLMLYRVLSTANTKYPAKLDQTSGGATLGYYDNSFSMYQSLGWAGWYPPHAIYEKDRADLSDEERRARQQDCRISYAMAFGRYIRGERRRLVVEFKGVVAPNWQSIRTGQTYTFTPVADEKTYIIVAIERNIREDVIVCEFEEQSPIELPMTYKVIGAGNKGTGSIDMNGGGGSPPTDSPLATDEFVAISPATVGRNKVIPPADGVVAYEAKKRSGSTADIIAYYDESDSKRVSIDEDFNLEIDSANIHIATDGDITVDNGFGSFNQGSIGTKSLQLSATHSNTSNDPTEPYTQGDAVTTDGTTWVTIQTIPTTSNTGINVHAKFIARRTGGTGGTAGDVYSHRVSWLVKNVTGTLTSIGSTTQWGMGSVAGTNVRLNFSGSDIQVQVRGLTNNTIAWHSHTRTIAIGS